MSIRSASPTRLLCTGRQRELDGELTQSHGNSPKLPLTASSPAVILDHGPWHAVSPRDPAMAAVIGSLEEKEEQQMDLNASGVPFIALLAILGSILSGFLGGFVGWAFRQESMRRQMERAAKDLQQMTAGLLEVRVGTGQGKKEVELAPGASLRGINLKGRDLEDLDLRDANLESANLNRSNLQRTNLGSANLLGADLQGADLRYATLEDANLDRANLLGANLQGAILSRALLRGADLRGANLLGADLLGAHLEWAKLDDETVMPEGWPNVVVSGPSSEAMARLVF
jgi:hypothetical protein